MIPIVFLALTACCSLWARERVMDGWRWDKMLVGAESDA